MMSIRKRDLTTAFPKYFIKTSMSVRAQSGAHFQRRGPAVCLSARINLFSTLSEQAL